MIEVGQLRRLTHEWIQDDWYVEPDIPFVYSHGKLGDPPFRKWRLLVVLDAGGDRGPNNPGRWWRIWANGDCCGALDVDLQRYTELMGEVP